MIVFKIYTVGKKFLFASLLIQLVSIPLFSQYTFDWAKTYGGDAWDEAFGMAEDSHGSMILCGYTKAQEKHLWVIKVDEQGNSQWGKTYKATPISEGRDIIVTSDSCIVTAGYSVKPFAYQSDLWIVKLNKDGEKIWDKSFGGDNDDAAKAITKTSDGNYVVAGVYGSNPDYHEDAWILKVDSSGEKLWDRIIGGKKTDYANDIIETSDKGLVVCGMTSSRGEGFNSLWVAKMDSSGTDLWDRIYRINQWDEATAVTQGLDGYIYVAGFTRTYSVIDYDAVVLKIDQKGELIWQKSVHWGRWDQATSICSTFDNGVVVCGFTRSDKELSSDFAATKLDENGNILWETVFVRNNSFDYPNKIIETRDNGLAMVGTTFETGRGWDFALLKYKNNDLPEINLNQDSISTSVYEKYNLKACISTKSNLKNIQVFFNSELFLDNIKRENSDKQSNCDIPLNVEVMLKKGINALEVVLTDYKGHQTRKACKIYFVPSSAENW